MTRIYPAYTYTSGPRDGCWWDETCAASQWTALTTEIRTEVAVIGAGVTGLSAALRLAEAGCDIVVLEEHVPGWGASGRNGGFCCLGGAKASDAAIKRRFGDEAHKDYRHAEARAVGFVAELLERLQIDADTHSQGETVLAHRPKDYEGFKIQAAAIKETLDVSPTITPKADLAEAGLAGPFHGAMTIPIGFGLNPRKYLVGLVAALNSAGHRVFGNSPVEQIKPDGNGYRLHTPQGTVLANKVIVATNGYSSDTMPKALSGRYLPTQSNVLVTRPLTQAELGVAGWTSNQMAYDTRNLLHYFRLMPDRRFLFGMRGGLRSGPSAEAKARAMVRRDFERMFPAWRAVESPHSWSGCWRLGRGRSTICGLWISRQWGRDGQLCRGDAG